MDRRWIWPLVALIGCIEAPDYTGRQCSLQSPCPDGYHCASDQRCAAGPPPPAADAAVILDGGPDSGALDAAPRDADTRDADTRDADPADAAAEDAAAEDAEALDVERPDLGPPDAGFPDALPPDLGPPDTGIPPDAGPLTLIASPAASADDALQDPTGPMLLAHGWISMYSADHWGGVRFALPGISPTSVIVDAVIEVFVDSTTEDNPNLVLRAQASADAPAFTTTNSDLSARPTTPTGVLWQATQIGDGYRASPRIDTLIREVIALPGWAPGNRVAIIFDSLAITQENGFEFRQLDYGAGFEARLVVHYFP